MPRRRLSAAQTFACDVPLMRSQSYNTIDRPSVGCSSMKELGFPFGVTNRISMHTPAGTPSEVVESISAAFEPAVNGDLAQTVGEQRSKD